MSSLLTFVSSWKDEVYLQLFDKGSILKKYVQSLKIAMYSYFISSILFYEEGIMKFIVYIPFHFLVTPCTTYLKIFLSKYKMYFLGNRK